MAPRGAATQDPSSPSRAPEQVLHRKNAKGAKTPDSRESTIPKLGAAAEELYPDLMGERPLQSFAKQPLFQSVVALEVTLNLLALGLEADLKCYHNCQASDFVMWWQLDQIFTAAAVLDVLIVLIALGPRVYFRGDRQVNRDGLDTFNCIDVFLVFLRVLDVWVLNPMGVATGVAPLKLASTLRIAHLFRLAQHATSLRSFRELWLITTGMIEVLKTVFIVLGLMLLLVWVSAIFMTLIAGKGTPASGLDFSKSAWQKDDYWGTVARSMLSMFQVLTRDKWSKNMVRPLVEDSPGLAVFFMFYLVLGVLALLSTIVGVVVESALASAKANDEIDSKKKEEAEEAVMRSLETFFRQADKEHNGILDRVELFAAIGNPTVRRRMHWLGFQVGDLDLLFTLLDEEMTGKIKTATFFRGCRRLCGPAMAKDLHQMETDLKRHMRWCEKVDDRVQKMNDSLSTLLDLVDIVDREVVKDGRDNNDPVLEARRARKMVSKGVLLRSPSTKKYFSPTKSSYVGKTATNFMERHAEPMVGHSSKGGFAQEQATPDAEDARGNVAIGRPWTSPNPVRTVAPSRPFTTPGILRSAPATRSPASAGNDWGPAEHRAGQPAPPPLPDHMVARTAALPASRQGAR